MEVCNEIEIEKFAKTTGEKEMKKSKPQRRIHVSPEPVAWNKSLFVNNHAVTELKNETKSYTGSSSHLAPEKS